VADLGAQHGFSSTKPSTAKRDSVTFFGNLGHHFSYEGTSMSKIRNAASVTFCLLLVAIASSCGTSHSGPTLTGIDLNPISPNILVNHTQQFTATGHFSDGSTANLTTNANWSSDNTTVATIENFGTQPGLATGKSAGQANITVSFAQGSSTVNASTDLTVEK